MPNGHSHEALVKAELDLMNSCEVEVTKQSVEAGKSIINTYFVGDPSKEALVLFHGFGAGGLVFCNSFKELSEKYYIVAPDLPGWAFSQKLSRPTRSYKDTQLYMGFVLEKWAAAAGLGNFQLVGHGFGGFIAALFAEKSPASVTSLTLVDPVGMDGQFTKADGFASVFSSQKKMRFFGPLGTWAVKKKGMALIKGMNPNDKVLQEYLFQIGHVSQIGEDLYSQFHSLFRWNVAIDGILTKIQVPVQFFVNKRNEDWSAMNKLKNSLTYGKAFFVDSDKESPFIHNPEHFAATLTYSFKDMTSKLSMN